jgi:hypothetical protein
MVRAAFGSLDKAPGGDRLSEIFTLALKKNSKTTGGAASSKGRRGYHPSQR